MMIQIDHDDLADFLTKFSERGRLVDELQKRNSELVEANRALKAQLPEAWNSDSRTWEPISK